MYNIKFKGKYEDENELKKGELPINAIKYDEPDTMNRIFWKGCLISSPMLLVITILLFTRIGFKLNLTIIIIEFILLYVHEFIHGFACPKEIEKEVWTYFKEGALFVYFKDPVSKLRFIWLSLAPNLILGFIPFILVILGVFNFNNTLEVYIGNISWMMILGGIGDYLNIYNTIKQVPKGAKVMCYGFNSYWFE